MDAKAPKASYATEDRIGVLEAGRLIQIGQREELLTRPRSAFVAELAGLNLYRAELAEGRGLEDAIEAAVARLIPADETGPGAVEAAVPTYIDRQLAGAWGAGERLYRSGPWLPGKPEQGYQLPFSPAELFRNALRGILEDLRATKRGSFATLGADDQDAYLRTLERETKDLGGVPSNTFFKSLLELTIEGFFADPIYGGNKGMVGWKLIGFPGAFANYYELVDQHGIALNRPPMSVAQNAGVGDHAHPDPVTKRN